jgi:hypothetical protein
MNKKLLVENKELKAKFENSLRQITQKKIIEESAELLEDLQS